MGRVSKGDHHLVSHLTLKVLRRLAGANWNLVCSRIETERARLACNPAHSPPLIVQQLLISGEDHRHSRHPGFDSIAICRALWHRLVFESREGASTIEQQLVRVITGRYERTFRRKLHEILLAILVDAYFPKSVLPAVYLLIGYYGWRMNGYQQACCRLGFRPSLLTLEEAAALIARLKYPEAKIAPASRFRQIQWRRKHLVALYQRHIRNGTYEHLNGNTLYNNFRAHDAVLSLP